MSQKEKSRLVQSPRGKAPLSYKSINISTASSASIGVDSLGSVSAAEEFHSTLFKRRWWIISVFCLCAATQSILWNSFSPVTYAMKVAYNWNDSFIALLPGMSNFAFVLTAFPLMYLVETRGLRLALLICAALMMFCMSLWIFGLSYSYNWMMYAGSMFDGIAGAIFMAAPPLLSVLWFPVRERTTATALSAAAGYLGTGVAFLSGPFISGANITGSEMVSNNFSTDYILNLQNGLMNVLYFDAGLCLMCFLGVVLYFPNKPPKAPSLSANIERVDFKTGLKSLVTNGSFWLLNVAYNLPNATYNSWLPLISISFESLGVSEGTAGWLGFASIISGVIASITVAVFADHFKRHTKAFLVIMTCGEIACFAVLVCVQQRYIYVSPGAMTPTLYAVCILTGAFVNGVIPLYYELACECVYPVHEGLANEFLCVINNLTGMTFFFVFLVPSLAKDTQWMTWLCLGSSVTSLPLLLMLKEHYYRLDVDNRAD